MTLNELKTKANTKLADFWTELQIKQEAYYLKHDKFFQLLITDPVIDGVDTAWVLRTPSDEQHAIDVDFSFNSPVPFQISIDEFVGPTTGYSATATVELPNGTQYRRTRKAVPTVQETPKAITGWTEEDTDWFLLEQEQI